ncbi:MAG: hypothetical protein C0603_06760 [Denitrovibrio sp.]|nr:MAG: hypothetical protein C0603_06760 [Denitrovibrio sp.]
MRLFLIFIILVVSIPAFATPPTDKQLDEYFKLSGMAQSYNSTISSIYMPLVKMMQTNLIKMKEKDKAKADRVSGKIVDSFNWEYMKPKIYSFYKQNYSADEISRYISAMSSQNYLEMRNKQNDLTPAYDKMMQSLTIQTLLQIAIEVELEEQFKK